MRSEEGTDELIKDKEDKDMSELHDKQARWQIVERMEQREPTSELDWPSRDRRRLCQRYLNAETSVEEERQLADYYAKTTDPLSLEEEDVRTILLSTVNASDDFDLSKEKVTEFDRLMTSGETRKVRLLPVIGWLTAVAASVAVLFVLFGHHPEDKADEPQIAVVPQEEIKTEPVAEVMEVSAPAPIEHRKKPARRKNKPSETVKGHSGKTESEAANEETISTVMAAANVMGEQVETYHIQPVGDATIVTKTFVDGTSSSCIVCSMDGGSGYSVIPL